MSSSRNDKKAVLDTSFLIRLLDESNSLHENALGYYRFFLENEYSLYVSTVSIAEYCVKGSIEFLPWNVLKILPFNLDHAQKSGSFAAVLFNARKDGSFSIDNRLIIPNDTKIFAQTALIQADFFVTADSRSAKVAGRLADEGCLSFTHLDIHTPYTESFGVLPL